MRRIVVVISGHICTGKSGLARRLEEQFGFHRMKTADLVRSEAAKRGSPTDRKSLQEIGDLLDEASASCWTYSEFERQSREIGLSTPVVIDSIRTWKQLEPFRSSRQINLVHVHLYGSKDQLRERFERKVGPANEYDEANIVKHESDIEAFSQDADVRINTDFTDGGDTVVRVAARLRLYPPPDLRCVDVIIGGQFGSEGKGHVAAYLAQEYDVLVRVGGPNAGHTVSGPEGVYTYHQLPSGARDTDAKLLLGPGMTINVAKLLDEIRECEITPDRLFIDPQAMIISDADIEAEDVLRQRIGSTASGSGSAAARRIMGRGDASTLLACNVPELSPFVGDGPPYRGETFRQLEVAYRRGQSVLFEGTQGSGLSVFHGQYPYVTSRDTNVAGCLAEAGISPARVRRIIMVIRPAPIRVANPEKQQGSSGPLKHETSFERVAGKAGLNAKDVLQHEKTSTTKRDRRVGYFDWEHFRKACALNAPTDIVLAFADYLHAKNGNARRFEQLHPDTIKFIEELEQVADAPVSLINTRFPRNEEERFDLRTVIDRRTWMTRRFNAARN